MKLNMTMTTRTWVDIIAGDKDGPKKTWLIYQRPRSAHMGKCIFRRLPERFFYSSHPQKVLESEHWIMQSKKPIVYTTTVSV